MINEPKLFANKFKTVEDLEKAYGNSVTAMVEKARLEKELERYRAPESYVKPQDVPFTDEQFGELQGIAKEAALTQEQFERVGRVMHLKVVSNKESQENMYNEKVKSIGEEKINLIKDYVEKNYPQSVRDVVLDKLIRDDNAMSDAMKDRDSKLNTQAPGMSGSRGQVGEKYEGQNELIAAVRAAEANPRDMRLREKVVNLARDVGHARKR